MNKGNHHQFKTLLIIKHILLARTIGNVQRTLWRICILMLGCKGLRSWVHDFVFATRGCPNP